VPDGDVDGRFTQDSPIHKHAAVGKLERFLGLRSVSNRKRYQETDYCDEDPWGHGEELKAGRNEVEESGKAGRPVQG
jgi:hypothetical protein